MLNAAQYAERPVEDKIMTDLAVHQDPYLEQPQQPQQLSAQPPGTSFSILTLRLTETFLQLIKHLVCSSSTDSSKRKEKGKASKR